MSAEGANTADPIQGVPDSYIRCGCCAINCCAWDNCFGCKDYTELCCIQGTTQCCNTVENEDVCCLLQSSMCTVGGCGFYNCYRQHCCIRYVFSCGCDLDSVYSKAPASATVNRDRVGFPNAEDVTICEGGCCTLTGFYFSCPECLGCASSGTLCCIEENAMCCKSVSKDPNNQRDDVGCICNKSECLCVPLKSCLKVEFQEFCLYSSCACPCDDDVPCVYGTLGAICCINWGCNFSCCPNLQHIRDIVNPQAAASGTAILSANADSTQA